MRTCLINNLIEDKWTCKNRDLDQENQNNLFSCLSKVFFFLIPVLDTDAPVLLIPYLNHTIRVI